MPGKKSGMKEVIESTNLEKQLTRHHEGDSDYTHQGTGSSKKVLIAAVCLTLGYAVIEVIGVEVIDADAVAARADERVGECIFIGIRIRIHHEVTVGSTCIGGSPEEIFSGL